MRTYCTNQTVSYGASPFTSENPVLIVSGLAAVFLVVVAGLCVGGAVLTAVLKDRRQR